MPPTTFIVPGTPKSLRASRRDRWKAKVAAAAVAALPAGFRSTAERVEVRLVFCVETTNLDADNIVKPILDGLDDAGVYVSDAQVADLIVSLRTFAEASSVRSPPPALSAALPTIDGDFVLIAIRVADRDRLP